MSVFKLEINLDNSAYQDEEGNFEPHQQIIWNLKAVTDGLEQGSYNGRVYDLNGNRVGNWSIQE